MVGIVLFVCTIHELFSYLSNRRAENLSTTPSPTLTQQDLTSSSDSDSDPEVLMKSSPEQQWALLLAELAELLDEKTLPRMKTAFEQRVLSKPTSAEPRKRKSKLENGAFIVKSCEYKEATTVHLYFKLLAPLWCWNRSWPLGLILKASGCKPAMEMFQEFLRTRESNGELLPQSEPAVLTERHGLPPREVEV